MLAKLLFLFLLHSLFPSNASKDCEEFKAELHSRPDFTHKVMTSSMPLPPDFSITFVRPDYTKGRSFYWCEMELKDRPGKPVKMMKRYGHNATHWWVTKGCGGWFTIKACHQDDISNNTNSTDLTTTSRTDTSTVKETSSKGGNHTKPKKHAQFSDLNSGALLSLASWLQEHGGSNESIHQKLGASTNSRVVRSVEEEFVLEFGLQ